MKAFARVRGTHFDCCQDDCTRSSRRANIQPASGLPGNYFRSLGVSFASLAEASWLNNSLVDCTSTGLRVPASLSKEREIYMCVLWMMEWLLYFKFDKRHKTVNQTAKARWINAKGRSYHCVCARGSKNVPEDVYKLPAVYITIVWSAGLLRLK